MDSTLRARYMGLVPATLLLCVLPVMAGLAGRVPARVVAQRFHDLQQFLYEDPGKATPELVRAFADYHCDALCLAVVVLAVGAAFLAALRGRKRTVFAIVGVSTVALLGVGMVAVRLVRDARNWQFDWHRGCMHEFVEADPSWRLLEEACLVERPGRVAQIAEEVVERVRASLRAGPTRNPRPDGAVRDALRYSGSDVTFSDPTSDHGDLPASDAAVVLPYGPADNEDPEREFVAVFPPRGGDPPSLARFPTHPASSAIDDFPRVYVVDGDDRHQFRYAFTLQRARVDIAERHGYPVKGPYLEGMFLLRVHVFRTGALDLPDGVAELHCAEEFECLVLR